jgi:hypothetical protein
MILRPKAIWYRFRRAIILVRWFAPPPPRNSGLRFGEGACTGRPLLSDVYKNRALPSQLGPLSSILFQHSLAWSLGLIMRSLPLLDPPRILLRQPRRS